jgi:hypothetical protein
MRLRLLLERYLSEQEDGIEHDIEDLNAIINQFFD